MSLTIYNHLHPEAQGVSFFYTYLQAVLPLDPDNRAKCLTNPMIIHLITEAIVMKCTVYKLQYKRCLSYITYKRITLLQ